MLKRLLSIVSTLVILIGAVFVYPGVSNASPINKANDTIFGPNVYVFDPSMPDSDIQNVASSIYDHQETNEFGTARKAMLFKPGSYNVNVNVGFYTEVAGMGKNPGNVNIKGGVNVDADRADGRALTNFWRSIENLTVTPTSSTLHRPSGTMQWAVSQAAPMRRVHVKGNLALFDFDSNWNPGYASGGFMSDTVVDGKVTPASQQQWFSRNNEYGSWSNGVWNMVFVGDENPPSGDFKPYTTVKKTPVIKNKPFIYVTDGKYKVFVPALQKNIRGVSWTHETTPGKSIPIDQFYIARPDQSDTASINAALDKGKNLIFTPGIYHLKGTVHITKPNTVVLGMGYATLSADNGQTAMSTADVDGVNISGLLFDAGAKGSPSLLTVGQRGSSANHSENPISLHDLFFRVGGAQMGKTKTSLIINSNDVIGDHFWAWRADHGQGVGWNKNTAANGVIVNGDNVTLYGLFVEHFQKYQTLWNGNGGQTYFYQSEMPYDIPNQNAWMSHHGTVNGFASYKVANSVTSHEAWGLGVYSFFRDAPVKLQSAISVPNTYGLGSIKMHHMISVWLTGVKDSEITHVINNTGKRVTESTDHTQTIKNFTGGNRTGAYWIKKDIENLPTGSLVNPQAAHALDLQLTTVDHFEEKGSDHKVIKHLNLFKVLLRHQKNEDMISDMAYHALKEDTNYLLGKYQ